MNNGFEVLAERDTLYGKAYVKDRVEDGEPIRYLFVNNTVQSAVYLDPERRYDLMFPYLDMISWMIRDNEEIRDVYLIGGGAFAFARHFVHEFLYKNLDAAENDPEIIRLAKEYFDLEKTIRAGEDRLRIIEGDALEDLRHSDKKYDMIINDAFGAGRSKARTQADTALIKQHLTEQGVYITNVTSAVCGPHAFNVRKFRDMLKKQFAYVNIVPVEEERDPLEKQNILAFASDAELTE